MASNQHRCESNGLPLRGAGVACEHCGCTDRRPTSNHCAGCGRFAPDPRYAYSWVTDTWYRVPKYDDLGDGKIQAKSKEEVPRDDVPQAWLNATDERGEV